MFLHASLRSSRIVGRIATLRSTKFLVLLVHSYSYCTRVRISTIIVYNTALFAFRCGVRLPRRSAEVLRNRLVVHAIIVAGNTRTVRLERTPGIFNLQSRNHTVRQRFPKNIIMALVLPSRKC